MSTNKMSRNKSTTVAWFNTLVKCNFGHWKVHCDYKINDQPICEQVTASIHVVLFL